MMVLKGFVFILFLGNVHGLFGIGGFFRSAKRSTETLTRVAQEQSAAFRTIMEEKIVPDVQQTLKKVRKTADDIVNITHRMEKRLEKALDNFDETVRNIGQNVNHVVDIIIVLSCIALFCVCSKVNSSSRDAHVKHEFLTLLMCISLVTATGIILRVFYVSVLKIQLTTTAETLKYCVIYPISVVFLWKVLRVVYFLLCQVGVVFYFFILGPRLIVFITLDGPMKWVWNAYKYAPELNSRKAMILTVSLPWLMFCVSLLVFNIVMKVLGEGRDQQAFATGIVAAYLYFYCTSIYLYKHHQRPEPRERLRAIYGGDRKKYESN